MLDLNFSIKFPVTRGQQAKRFYQVVTTLETLVRLLRFDDAGTVLERSQRPLNKTRANSVAKYVLNNVVKDQFLILPALCGIVDSPEDEEPVYEASTIHADLGILHISPASYIKLFDGQHRAGGCSFAHTELAEIVASGKVDKKLLKKLKKLSIAIMLHTDLTLEERQQAFTDINQNGTKANKALNFTYNNRDPLPSLGKALASECICFENMVDYEHNTPDAQFLFSIKAITDSTATLISYKKNSAIDLGQKELAKDFWEAVSKAMSWSGLGFALDTTGDNSPAGYKRRNITTHTIMTQALGYAGKHIIAHFGNLEDVDFSPLGKLNYSRDPQVSDFTNRCIDMTSNTMLTKRVNKILTSNVLLKSMGVPLTPADAEIEEKYFPSLNPKDVDQITSHEDQHSKGEETEQGLIVGEVVQEDIAEATEQGLIVGEVVQEDIAEETEQGLIVGEVVQEDIAEETEQGLIVDSSVKTEAVQKENLKLDTEEQQMFFEEVEFEQNMTVGEFLNVNGEMVYEIFRDLIGEQAPSSLEKAQKNFERVLTEKFENEEITPELEREILDVVQNNIEAIGDKQTKLAFNTLSGTRTMFGILDKKDK